jgi:hypothetical protein
MNTLEKLDLMCMKNKNNMKSKFANNGSMSEDKKLYQYKWMINKRYGLSYDEKEMRKVAGRDYTGKQNPTSWSGPNPNNH